MKSTLLILQYINNVEMIENHEWVELKFYKMFCNSISPYCAGESTFPKSWTSKPLWVIITASVTMIKKNEVRNLIWWGKKACDIVTKETSLGQY